MAEKQSLTELFDQLQGEGAALAAPPVGPPITAVHRAAVDVMTDLIGMAGKLGDGARNRPPAPMMAMLRMLQSGQPMLLEQLRTVDPREIQAFIRQLRDQMDRILTIDPAAP